MLLQLMVAGFGVGREGGGGGVEVGGWVGVRVGLVGDVGCGVWGVGRGDEGWREEGKT
jgi:hypothetical protein